MANTHIYPEKIRRFEQEIINFIVESGKNKRTSDIESHILSYFLLHPKLIQKQIQELSSIFRKKKISRGSISKFLNQYERYGVIEKKIIKEKRYGFIYSLKDENLSDLLNIGFKAGLNELENWIKYNEIRVRALSEITSKTGKEELHSILINRLKELKEFLQFHKNLMKKFLSKKISGKDESELRIQKIEIDEIKKKGMRGIEEDIINFFQNNPLFMIEEVQYLPLLSYLITRKRLTQSKLQKLTGLSSGLISEGLNYFLQEGYIKMEKIKGIRKRFYIMPSIAYSNYLKQYKRLRRIHQYKDKFEQIYQKLTSEREELSELEGYDTIYSWVSQFLGLFGLVEKGIKIFKKALTNFENPQN